jgi:hypothetical protein
MEVTKMEKLSLNYFIANEKGLKKYNQVNDLLTINYNLTQLAEVQSKKRVRTFTEESIKTLCELFVQKMNKLQKLNNIDVVNYKIEYMYIVPEIYASKANPVGTIATFQFNEKLEIIINYKHDEVMMIGTLADQQGRKSNLIARDTKTKKFNFIEL